ncbi:MAG: N-acetylneuraminate synthase [Deltaproteobacteria bacterium]|nr:N-acetylneuraminate synthase [Deltaproteobacteria bacterium]
MPAPRVLSLGGKKIGPGHPVYVIAEAGVNHNGDVKLALDLVREASKAGADCVKFQTFKAEAIVTQKAPKAAYQLQVTDPGESQLAMLKKLELSKNAYGELIALCKKLGIQFLSTPYNFNDVDFLEEVGVDGYKIASGQLVELPFIEYVARLGKPIFVSTGMATMDEVADCVKTIRAAGNEQFVVLQCTTNYPSPTADANLRAMLTMGEKLGVTIGYSDHTETSHAVLASVALGATVVEKHFTLDRKLPGPDHSSSYEPREFAELVSGIRLVEQAMGSAVKTPSALEARNTVGMRRSLVAVVDIKAGAEIRREQLAFKRPATGLKPNLLNQVVGKRARKDIAADTPLTEDQIEW